MSLSEQFEAEAAKCNQYAGRCWYVKFKFTDAQRAALDAALAADHIPARAVANVLADWGFSVGPDQIRRHLNGICKCPT